MATTTLLKPTPAPPEHWNTLQILKASRLGLIALDALLLLAALNGHRIHFDAMKTVGKDSAPSIIAAQHIKSALADMDADAANELLGAPGVQAYEDRREEAANAIISAAENITYGDAERAPLQKLQIGTGTYERLIQRARDLKERGDAQFVAAYRDAAKVMDDTLLPAADALDKANDDALEQSYESQASSSSWARTLVFAAGFLLFAGLIAEQMFLSRRTRRTLNPLLLAATLVAIGSADYAQTAMVTERDQLKVAKDDAFNSIRALWRARALAYQANSEESRYLLDQSHAAAHELSFTTETATMAKLPNKTITEIVNAEAQGIHVPGFSGYLADELNNITFPGERQAALEMLRRFEDYVAVDQQIRLLERGGKHSEAVALGIGTKAGQSDYVFDQFDKALGATLDINQKAFDVAVTQGMDALSNLDVKISVAAAAIAVLIFLGLAVRIREYQ